MGGITAAGLDVGTTAGAGDLSRADVGGATAVGDVGVEVEETEQPPLALAGLAGLGLGSWDCSGLLAVLTVPPVRDVM